MTKLIDRQIYHEKNTGSVTSLRTLMHVCRLVGLCDYWSTCYMKKKDVYINMHSQDNMVNLSKDSLGTQIPNNITSLELIIIHCKINILLNISC